jgi:DNA-binding transcriptional MerR regulator
LREEQMLKIGFFSRLSGLSVKALRYYDQIGLFSPAQVDPFTGYRYYTVGQLADLNRILALKDLGLSLGQISAMVQRPPEVVELKAMLRRRRAQLLEQSAALAAELERVEARLRQLEMEDKMPEYEVVLKSSEPILVASRRLAVPSNDQVPELLSRAFRQVSDYLNEKGAIPAGPCLTRWHSPPDSFTDEDVEVIFPIRNRVPGTDEIELYDLPTEQVAAVVHRGRFEEFTRGHEFLLGWLEAHGYRLNGAYREIYHRNDEEAESVTEIQFPIEKV